MKERPILFNGAMVNALLSGAKTQTRRVVKLPVERDPAWVGGWKIVHKAVTLAVETYNRLHGRTVGADAVICPYGQPGDRLWVREAFACTDTHEPEYDGSVDFRADGKCYAVSGNQLVDVPSLLDPFKGPWRPGIHMPRWASRILLEITSVHVERLQGIGEADARAEGVTIEDRHTVGYCAGEFLPPSIRAYRDLWESINGAGSWDANPWVWVVEFKRVTP